MVAEVGAAHVVAHVQALNPSASGSGAEGVPITLPLESVSSISSDGFRLAGRPFTVAPSNIGEVRFGREARPGLVPRISGVSSIHSAVACVEL